MKLSSGDRIEYMRLPIKVEHNSQIYWIKEATKTAGIYMNNIEPKEEKDVLPISNNIPKQSEIQ